MDNKLGVIVPYRNRYEHLLLFKAAITDYLKSKDILFELIIVEQDDAKLFNRGKLLNIGFEEAKKLKCTYVVFHDIDMLPLEVDYSFSKIPLLLATQKISFDEFFSSVILFPIEYFEKINGYSNTYWGWGFEDDDLFYRCKLNNIPLNIRQVDDVRISRPVLKFNGIDAYVKSLFRSRGDATVHISFELLDLILDHKKFDDEFIIFSLPKINLKLCYDSYGKYKVIIDNKDEIFSINTERQEKYRTNLTITITGDKVVLYQEGVYKGEVLYKSAENRGENNFYIDKSFKGLLYTVAIYDTILNENEIKQISENKFFSLTSFDSSQYLKTYYETNFIKNYQLVDLSENNNKGKVNNCEIVLIDEKKSYIKKVPFSRESKFKELEHVNNGFENGGWKDINTRYNQLRYYNEVSKGYHDTREDGLSNCDYKIYSNTRIGNQTHLIVGI